MQVVHRLYLLRHAKSSWEGTDLPDRARPLSHRGEQAARDVAAYLHREGTVPSLVLCSVAVRTRQTLAALSLPSEISYEGAIYGATALELLARLQRIAEDKPSVMVVGHNPGLHDLALSLAGKGGPRLLARLHEGLPTGALVDLAFQGPWASLDEGQATLESLVLPRELRAEEP
jgi:phosphohistidine phosphatase